MSDYGGNIGDIGGMGGGSSSRSRDGRTEIDFGKMNTNDPGLNCGTLYLRLEPIKTPIDITSSFKLENTEVDKVTNTSPKGTSFTLTVGNTAFSGLTNGKWLQFCKYDPMTGFEEEIISTKQTIFGGSTSVNFTFRGIDDRKYSEKLDNISRYGRCLIEYLSKPDRMYTKPYLKVYVLPDNYVVKHINISTIQSYWQDPSYDNVMWVQHTSCCSFNSGPFSVTVTAAEGETPAAIGQTALASKATTGLELFHNIIPRLDTIMTYAN